MRFRDELGTAPSFTSPPAQPGGADATARLTPELAVRALLVGGLVGALIAAFAAVGGQLIPGWDGRFLVAWCVVAGAVAQWTDWLIRERLPLNFNRVWFRATELSLLLALFQLGDTLIGGRPGGFARLFTPDARLAFAAVLILAAWSASAATAGEFARLGEVPGDDQEYVPPLQTLTGRFLGGGVALLVIVAVGQVVPRELFDLRSESVTGPILTLLTYFGLGMILLALAQHTLHRRRWQEEGLPVAEGIGGRWVRHGGVVIGAAALLAFALPTGWAGILIDALALVLQGIIWLIALLGLGFAAPFIWVLSKIRGTPVGSLPSQPVPVTPPPDAPVAETGGGSPLELLRWLLFAAIAIALITWFVRGWLENRGDLKQALGRFAPLRLLRSLLSALLARLRGMATAIGERLPRGLGGQIRDLADARPRLRLRGARTPREQIVRYYLSVVQRAGAQGVPRRPAQSPEEYGPTLAPHLADADTDWSSLTAEFIEARYSAHNLAPDDSKRARSHWQRVRDALRLRRRGEEEENGGSGG